MISIEGLNKPYLIAEAGVSHFGSFQEAKKLLSAAIKAKCNAFKIQVFDVDKLFANNAEGWKDRLKKRVLNIDEISKLSEICDNNNIDFIITPHDDSIFPFIEKIKLNAIKIGSGEVGNLDFISKCFDLTDFLIFSTGLSTIEDIDKIVDLAKLKAKKLAILHCNTSYPTVDNDVNLSVLNQFIKRYPDHVIGYSDHTEDHLACQGAVFLGAKIIERHITLRKNIPNAQDWKVSSLPDELIDLRSLLDRSYLQLGSQNKFITESAMKNIYWACKSPYLKKDVKKGELVSTDNYCMQRPFNGTKLEDLAKASKKAIFKNDMKVGTALTSENIVFV